MTTALPSWWTVMAALLTLGCFTFLYRDNPIYRFIEHLVVGVSVGYAIAITWHTAFIPWIWDGLFKALAHDTGNVTLWLRLIPVLLGLVMYTLFVPGLQKISWLARYSICWGVGVSIGFGVVPTIEQSFLQQVHGTLFPAQFAGPLDMFNYAVILFAVITVLMYFYFSKEHTGTYGRLATVGVYFLMVSFGANFGYTVMARISLLIDRVQFLMGDVMHLVK